MNKIGVNIVAFMFSAVLVSGCSGNKLNVKEERVTVEYGSAVSLKAEDYLDNDEGVLSKVKVSSDVKKEYPSVGEYTIHFAYKKQNVEIQVSVVDTTKPEFVDFKDTLEIYQNDKIDFEGLYAAEDLSEVSLSFDNSQVNYAESGSYVATVKAEDKWGNAESREVTVNVLPVTVELDKESESIYVGDILQLAATVNVPEGKAVFSSSDSEIASVDENGLVSGVKSGEVTITAELNGIKDECKVAVSEKPTKSSNSGNKAASSNTSNASSGSASSGSADNSGSNASQPSYEEPVVVVVASPQTSREAFDVINAERVVLGLEPAVWDAECERIALIRAQEVYDVENLNETTAHEGFWKFQNANRKLGECVAYGYGSASGAVNGWMNSYAHKEILMAPNYTKLAVAYCGDRWVAVNSR